MTDYTKLFTPSGTPQNLISARDEFVEPQFSPLQIPGRARIWQTNALLDDNSVHDPQLHLALIVAKQ